MKIPQFVRGVAVLISTPAEISKGQRRKRFQQARKLLRIF